VFVVVVPGSGRGAVSAIGRSNAGDYPASNAAAFTNPQDSAVAPSSIVGLQEIGHIRSLRRLAPENLPLFSRLLQFPIPLCMDLQSVCIDLLPGVDRFPSGCAEGLTVEGEGTLGLAHCDSMSMSR
jgi:hypothetical protein